MPEMLEADEQLNCGEEAEECPAASEAHVDTAFCPVAGALTLLNGRWTPHIIHELLMGQTRFNEIARALRVNPRTLRERLRELEEEGVVARRVITLMPPSVEYTLTEKGQALEKVFDALGEWGLKWVEAPLGKE